MLIQCPECSREISDSAATCPHCGYSVSESDKAKAKEQADVARIRAEREAAVKAEKEAADRSNKKIASWVTYGGVIIVLLFLWRACSSVADKDPAICNKSDAWMFAEQAVEGVLKNPDEADFHNPSRWEVEDDPLHPGQYIVTGEVTATNSFNAKIRQTFKAVVRCDKGTWYTGRVTMQ